MTSQLYAHLNGFCSLLKPNHRRLYFNPWSLFDWTVVITPSIILVLAAMMAMRQRPQSSEFFKSFRIALFPVGVVATWISCTFRDLSIGNPRLTVRNYGMGLYSFTLVMKLIEMTFISERPKRIRRVRAKALKASSQDDDQKTAQILYYPAGSIADAVSYLLDVRGVNSDFGMDTFFPPFSTKVDYDEHQLAFIWRISFSCLRHFLLFDLLQTSLQMLPAALGTPFGGSIYLPDDTLNQLLPIPIPIQLKKYMMSTYICLHVGVAVYAGLNIGYLLITLFGVIVVRQLPSQFPPFFYRPWLSTSLTSFWSKRWHAMFKRNFTFVGWYPGVRLFGKPGGVLFVFLVSGLLHDVAIWGMQGDTDPLRIVGFFLLHGIGMLMEQAWRKATGKRVDGILGRIWATGFMFSAAHLIVDAWSVRGLLGSQVWVEDKYRPVWRLAHWIIGSSYH